jgi:hypothetical protein
VTDESGAWMEWRLAEENKKLGEKTVLMPTGPQLISLKVIQD